LEPLLGHTWEAKGKWAAGDPFYTQSTFEWVPLADTIYARVLGKDGEHVLDAYVYPPHRNRQVALPSRYRRGGGVYEGDLTVLDGGALQFDLKGYEGDRVVPHVVRFDFEEVGTVRYRVWSVRGTETHAHARHLPPEAQAEERLISTPTWPPSPRTLPVDPQVRSPRLLD